jgi:hypothetical protein
MLFPTVLALAITLARPDSATYAVLDIANESGQITALSNYIGDELSMTYGSDSGYQLVERAQIHKVFKEHGFQSLGAVDAATAASLGKILGANRLITGSYFAVGDAYETHVRILDVQTGKIVRMFKTSFLKSPSTSALAANILTSESATSAGSNSPTQSDTTKGPLTLDRCRLSGSLVQCDGLFFASSGGRLQIESKNSRFFYQDGIETSISSAEIAGNLGLAYTVPAGIKVAVRIFFGGNGSAFQSFNLKYSVDGKEYIIQGPRPIN